jgi:hypothetical protein
MFFNYDLILVSAGEDIEWVNFSKGKKSNIGNRLVHACMQAGCACWYGSWWRIGLRLRLLWCEL